MTAHQFDTIMCNKLFLGQHGVFPHRAHSFWFNLAFSPNFPQLCKYLTVVPPPHWSKHPAEAHQILRAAIVDCLHFTFVSALLPQFRIIIKCKIILRVKTILYDHGGRTGERRATWDNIRYLIVHGHAAKHRIIMADNGGNMLITSSITFLEFYNLSWYLQFRRVRQIIEWKPKNLEDYFVSICKMAIKVKHSFDNQQSTKLSITLTRSVLSPINSRCIKAFLEAMEIGSIYCG